MTADEHVQVMAISARPDLSAAAARLKWEAFPFFARKGIEIDGLAKIISAETAEAGPPKTFVLLITGEPAGTVSLVRDDLESRRDLSPWLAGMVIDSRYRKRGYAALLIAAVEIACRDAGVPRVWLYTSTAERVYRAAGWNTTEYFHQAGRETALMFRDL